MRPWWRSASGSLRNRPNRCVQNAPRVVQVFWPDRRQPPAASSRTALLWMPARSLPAFGSDQPWHHVCSPGGHLGEDAVLLLRRAELEDRRREQEDAVLRDALRRAGAVVLLLEDQPLPQARVAAAVLARATTPPPSGRRRACAPTRGARRSPRGCRPTAAPGGARWPRARRGTRRGTLLGGGEREVHGRRDRSGAAPDGRNRPDLVIAARAGEPAQWAGEPPHRVRRPTRASPRSTSSVRTRCSPPRPRSRRRTGGEADAYRVEVAAPEAGSIATTAGPSIVADRALRCGARRDRHAGDGRRRGRARRRDRSRARRRRARDSRGAAGGSRRCARARTCSPRPGCSTAGARRPTGRGATSSRTRVPGRHGRRRPDLRPRRQRVDVGRRDRGHGPRARAGRRRPRPRRRADDRAPTRAVRAAAGRPVAVQRATRRAGRGPRNRSASCSTGSSSIPTPTSRVDRLAAHVAMSPRHFARVFRERGRRARRPPTSSACASRSRAGCSRRPTPPSTRSPAASGFGTAETMRRAFARRVGAAPREYRDRFRPSPGQLNGKRHGHRILLFDGSPRSTRSGPTRCCHDCPAREVGSSRPSAGRCAPSRACSASSPTTRATRSRSADVLLVPGGFATRPLERRRAAARMDPRDRRDQRRGPRRCAPARCCSARPGCSQGKEATTHWASLDGSPSSARRRRRSASSSRART